MMMVGINSESTEQMEGWQQRMVHHAAAWSGVHWWRSTLVPLTSPQEITNSNAKPSVEPRAKFFSQCSHPLMGDQSSSLGCCLSQSVPEARAANVSAPKRT
jgi:hypothetical protein